MLDPKSPSVQTFVGGFMLILVGRYLFAGYDYVLSIPVIGKTPLDVAAMLCGFGCCAWALNTPRELVQFFRQWRSKRSSSVPPKG